MVLRDSAGAVFGALCVNLDIWPWAELSRRERLELFRGLDERGVFAVRRAVTQVAARLGISRASAYSYLSQARALSTPPDGTPDTPPDGILGGASDGAASDISQEIRA